MIPYKVVHIYTEIEPFNRMPGELTLETLQTDLAGLKTMLTEYTASDDDKKEKEAAMKKAEEDKKEEEKKEAKKAAKTAALKTAMEEEDPDKRDAAIKKAMDEDPKKHEAFGEPKEKTAEEKEKDEHVASIIEQDKQTYITKILTAATITNPQGLKEIEAIVKSASITKLKEMAMLTPSFEGSVAIPESMKQEKFIPYFANANPAMVDASMLTASSPDSAFNNISTKDLLEGKN